MTGPVASRRRAINLIGITSAGVLVLAVRHRRALRRNIDTANDQPTRPIQVLEFES
jgi:hypothetical protein